MIRRLVIGLFALALLAGVAVAAGGWWLMLQLKEPHRAWNGDSVSVSVAPGTSATTILQRLESEGVIADARLARLYLIHRLGDPSLKAGEYVFDQAMTIPQVLDKLQEGSVVTYPVTLIEGLTADEAIQVLANKGFGDLATLRKLISRPDLIADLDPEAQNLEGYLYPDTYHFAQETTEEQIIQTLVDTFRKRYREKVAPLVDERDDLNLRDLVILASIVEKETQVDDERGLVASVYANRLRIGMGLYADPTIIYAKKLDGSWAGNLTRADLKMDSPYNTYVVAGLPPGPICSPSVASLLAAASPADSDFLYFVSRNDGHHVFARTKAEHDRNVYKWQKLYWRKRWADERAQAKSDGASAESTDGD